MKCFKYEGADRDNLSLQIALQEIESLPDDDECFIGFVNEKKKKQSNLFEEGKIVG